MLHLNYHFRCRDYNINKIYGCKLRLILKQQKLSSCKTLVYELTLRIWEKSVNIFIEDRISQNVLKIQRLNFGKM